MELTGAIVGTVGTLRQLKRQHLTQRMRHEGGQLRRGITRDTTHALFGTKAIKSETAAQIEQQLALAEAYGCRLISERTMAQMIFGKTQRQHPAETARATLAFHSGLGEREIALLSVFGCFERDHEPYTYHDLVMAKKFGEIVRQGGTWLDIARGVNRVSPIPALTARALHLDQTGLFIRVGENFTELDGQGVIYFEDSERADDQFIAAENAEVLEEYELALSLYGQCLAADPADVVTAFNMANCHKALGQLDEAANFYAKAIKADPRYVEAWYNFGILFRERGRPHAAREHLSKAIGIDPDYQDAIYNLAALEFDTDNWSEAARLWSRYLELDANSEWARTARKGIRYIELKSAQVTTTSAPREAAG